MSNYNAAAETIQIEMPLSILPPVGCLTYAEGLTYFQQTGGEWKVDTAERDTLQIIHGTLLESDEDKICPHCGMKMESHGLAPVTLKHVPHGTMNTQIVINRRRRRCLHCGCSVTPTPLFQAEGHRITRHLENLIEALLAMGHTLKDVAEMTGVDRHIVKDIDKCRLWERYTKDGRLIQPEQQARILGIDEFLLHKGHKYATLIMDLETGHILWLARSKKKQIVRDFIEHVGMEWMRNVKAICCDMNADFAEAFKEACPHLEVVFDRFHIVKNFNDKVISEVRKDEQRRLIAEGDEEGARMLKRSKYILTASRETLQRKDAEAGTVLQQKSDLFNIPEMLRKGGLENRYDELIASNKLLFTVDYVKAALSVAYAETDRDEMRSQILSIIDVCRDTENNHFKWFANLLESHLEGITAHALYPHSSGKVEGTMNLIKTVRRKGYGYPDDEYFFLKLFDISRNRRSLTA